MAFLAIADELHFGRAAARLHLAQPSLSQQLQRLERAVGVPLVARTSHEVRLTAAGRAFQVEARRLLRQSEAAVRTARDVAAGRLGRVRIGFNYPAGRRILPDVLARLRTDHPGVTTTLREFRSGPQLVALENGEIDVAFVGGPPASARLRSQWLMSVPLVAVVAPGHPWAGRQAVTGRDLAEQPCVLFSRDSSPAMYDELVSAAERHGGRLDVVDEVDDPVATAVVVSASSAVGFTSAIRAEDLLISNLVAVPLVDPVPTMALYAVWVAEPEETAEPAMNAFLRTLTAVMSDPVRVTAA